MSFADSRFFEITLEGKGDTDLIYVSCCSMLINDNSNKLDSLVNEKYKILRTNILHLNDMKQCKVILMTDVDGQIEKEKVIGSLGIAFSKLKDRKILIVDADFKKADLNSFFDVGNNVGLYNAVVQPSLLLQSIQVVIPNSLYFLGTGPAPVNTSELLSTTEMKSIIYYLKKTFDLTIINSTPICENADSQVIANLVDGNILLVKKGSTKTKKVKEAMFMLEKVNAKVLGAVEVT